jgi:anaerobic ribonucleoside-triphosphate reductase activating protein
VRVAGYYHHSLVEGPGRRSSVLLAGCDLACPGCWVPNLHPSGAGSLVPVDIMAAALLDPAHERDGVSILGGEPMLQPEGLLALVRALRSGGCPHIVCYSGRTYEALLRRARLSPAIAHVLDEIEVLIDGPYVAALAERPGPWTGSENQRVIDLAATRRAGHVVLLDERRATAA